jgi:hypothetical protein
LTDAAIFEKNPSNEEVIAMFTKIRHVAIHTDNHFRMANFYKTLFGMKKITAGMTDENGNYDKERGHLSDGVIGLACCKPTRIPHHHATRSDVTVKCRDGG